MQDVFFVLIFFIFVCFTRAIVDVGGVAVVYYHRLVMLNPVVNQSRTVLCTKLEIRNVDAPF